MAHAFPRCTPAMTSTQPKDDNARVPAVTDTTPASPPRCRRCRKVVVNGEIETYFARTGLCFWCAYVDAQG